MTRFKYDEAEADKRAVCYQTVDIFAGICSRKLYLKASKDGGASTNGHLIDIPFSDPNYYTMLEHEIGHILFRSDFGAKTIFVRDYTKSVVKSASSKGVALNELRLVQFLGDVLNILEDRRVNSLWGLLYPGSAVKLDHTMREHTKPHVDRASRELVTFMVCCSAGHSFPTAHPFSRYEQPIRDALSQVERRGFASALALTKWLVARLLDGIIEETKAKQTINQPLLETPPPEESEGSGEGAGSGGSGQSAQPSSQQQDTGEPPKDANEGETEEGEEEPQPDPTQERADAFGSLLAKAGVLPSSLDKLLNDVKQNDYASRNEQQASAQIARKALGLDPGDGSGLGKLLEQDQKDMFEVVRNARQTIRSSQNKDSYLTHGAKAKVVLKNVPKTPRKPPPQPPAPPASEKQLEQFRRELERYQNREHEDFETVRRIRSVFQRIQGKRRNALDEVGTEIDIQAFIERRVSGGNNPVFKVDQTGRGFRALVLLDQSGSMEGDKIAEAGRACRVLSKALAIPQVSFNVWGFASTAPTDGDGKKVAAGEVHIDRFDPRTEDFGEAKHMLTPLHTALYLARREMEATRDHRHVFVLTDGDPTFLNARGFNFSQETLRSQVRREVVTSRRRGIAVTTVVIGEDLEDKELSFMFGADWRRLADNSFGRGLVNLVTASFVRFLKAN